MPVFLSLSPLFLANAITFASSKHRRKKKRFSLCRCHVKNPHKQQEKLATSTQNPAQRLQSDCHRGSSLKKKQRKIDFSLQPFQTHDLGLIIVITSKRFFRGEDQSPFVSLH